MTSGKEIPVLLLTGYLGSGKTTLVNKILSNRKGIKFAVIVNDLGEVNIDADLIQKGGIVGKKDDSLVALQNGCICCTLKMDLIEQLSEIARMDRFDYIVIEASGICEPGPIAQTICSIPALGPSYAEGALPKLDCIVTVVDAARMQSEFNCGDTLVLKNFDEDDIENLVIQQIEFCNIVLLNKVSSVAPGELGRIKQIVKALQPHAEIIECDYGDVDLDKIIGTGLFNFEKVATSAAWIEAIEGNHEEEEDHDEEHGHHHHDEHHDHEDHHEHEEHDHEHHEHDHEDHEHDHEHCHCHHHHHHGEGEAEEYGIGTFVYYRRPALDINKFDHFVARKWPKNIIRAKGLCYFSDDPDKCYLFEQAGAQKSIKDAGAWYATMPEDELRNMMEQEPGLRKDWNPEYGDRMIKIVFIGQKLDKEEITRLMDECLDC